MRDHRVQIRLAGGEQAAPLLAQFAGPPRALDSHRRTLQLPQIIAAAVHVAEDRLASADLGGKAGYVLPPRQLAAPQGLLRTKTEVQNKYKFELCRNQTLLGGFTLIIKLAATDRYEYDFIKYKSGEV